MNNRMSKKLRKMINLDDNVISKRVYRRLKRQYKKLYKDARPLFLEEVDQFLNAKRDENLER